MRTLATAALFVCGLASVAAGDTWTINWFSIDGGGGRSSGGGWSLHGTIGQFDAATARMGGEFDVRPGLWPTGNPCRADFNNDGFVDFFDFGDFVDCFEGGSCPPGKDSDFNRDGFTDFFDFGDFVDAFELGC